MDYKAELLKLLENTDDWESLKTKLEHIYNTSLQSDSRKTTIAGKLFEYFSKYFFICNPLYQYEYKNVWLFDEIPLGIKKELNINHTDHGIDLLLEDKNCCFIAVQCKFKNDEESKLGWSKDKLGNLFGFASSIMQLIIFSNASEIDDVSKTRTDNLCFFSIKDLLALDKEFFDILRLYLSKNIKTSYKKAEPYEYQKKIISTVSSYFLSNDRGKLILPCGTGKTLVSLWIKENTAENLTLFLVPSLNLVRQTKNEWIKNSNTLFDYIVVCSEMDIDKEQDSSNIHLYDLDSFVTDKPNEIKEFVKKESANKKVIFSTYQSFKKIVDAYDEKLPAIDLAICDEAHRTASIDFGVFSLIHNDTENMCIKKRLYMTATPRVYSQTIKKNIEETGNLLFDMSDEKIYGKEIYRMSFAEAIQLGILVDYQIICLGVSDENLYALLKSNIYIDKYNSITDFVNNYAVKLAFEKYSINHAITFHSKVNQAQLFSERNEKIYPDIKSYFVSGRQTSSNRSIILNAFKNSEKAVVSNARCLTEGVDIPTVEAVFFCDPKNSKVDIVQAVGRTLRKDKNNPNKVGKIIIPVYFKKDTNVEEEIDSSVYNNVIKIIRSIADQDERLQDEINSIAYKQTSDFSGNSKIQFIYDKTCKLNDLIAFENLEKKVESALFGEIISKNATTWDLYYKELSDYLLTHSFIYPKEKENIRLYRWCTQQRVLYNKHNLSQVRISKLNDLNFVWNNNNDLWNEKFDKLVEFLKENDNRWPRQRNTTGLEHSLAVWMLKIGIDYRNGKLTNERYKKLISIGYIFEDRKWMTAFEITKQKITELGHFPHQNEDVNVYQWLIKQSRKYNSDKLSEKQRKLLDEIHIKDFIWGKDDWEDKFQYLQEYYEKNGKLPEYNEPFGYRRKVNFTRWAIRQRKDYYEGRLSKEQQDKLLSIGFNLDAQKENDDLWTENFTLLKQWLKNHENHYPGNTRSKDPLEKRLTGFVNYNRFRYREIDNRYGDYSEDRKKLLDSIGFEWNPNYNYKKCANKKWANNKWNENFKKAKEQITEYGTIPWQLSEKTNPVYNWLIRQKLAFKDNKLSKEKIDKLKEIGIDLEK